MVTSIADELYRKALDQVSALLTSVEAGRISVEAFRVGVESIWNVCGGVVDTADFNDLMTEANAHARSLPSPVQARVFSDGNALAVFMRTGEQVRVCVGAGMREKALTFDLENEAVDYMAKAPDLSIAKAMKEVRP